MKDISATLLFDQLVVEGYSSKEGRRLQLSLEGVRGGLLANTWTNKTSLGSPSLRDKYARGGLEDIIK